MSILKTLIDYSLFEKYDKEYFINNKIVPIYENDISIKFAVCKNSNLNTIRDDFSKLISFVEIEELELSFILNYIDKKILLYSLALKAILENSFEKSLDYFDIFCKEREIPMELYNSMKRWFILEGILI